MFLLRSAFWLTVAFIVVAPKGTDFGAAAQNASNDAFAAGQQMIAEQIARTECTSLECAGGKLVLTTLVGKPSPSIDTPMQDLSTQLVPVPRPRPDWMG